MLEMMKVGGPLKMRFCVYISVAVCVLILVYSLVGITTSYVLALNAETQPGAYTSQMLTTIMIGKGMQF